MCMGHVSRESGDVPRPPHLGQRFIDFGDPEAGPVRVPLLDGQEGKLACHLGDEGLGRPPQCPVKGLLVGRLRLRQPVRQMQGDPGLQSHEAGHHRAHVRSGEGGRQGHVQPQGGLGRLHEQPHPAQVGDLDGAEGQRPPARCAIQACGPGAQALQRLIPVIVRPMGGQRERHGVRVGDTQEAWHESGDVLPSHPGTRKAVDR
ncbi:hypothetical protein ACFFX0_10420 [Citricoccus parietis]|uniref:Uncharacterized protein n=1 Tax=Citricoccus parietis TaxID=592307 RepID=A0ABV5FY25_9MICC